ncbi:hypothetical protein PG990_007637 [Apiospora arundinis]
MKSTFFIAHLLAVAATATPMITYCDSENMQGSCTDIDSGDEFLCANTDHATMSIKVYDGFQCSLFMIACSPSGQKVYQAGTYNTIDDLWKKSGQIECVQH